MSFECEPCHVQATDKDFEEAGHFRIGFSHGRCETCGKTSTCSDCHCQGDWAGARKVAQTTITTQRSDDLLRLRQELLSE